ncbi:serine/threonine-protein kinase rio1 [Microplitis mediator]|uniref:serine/threonine-protein kinase rio1 n=1 Tax=Microplitis mediator TaxID=375433 RepID=UPI002553ECA7|nr:serine/threonine-protein kinase rio1 [Microplitis mediator]
MDTEIVEGQFSDAEEDTIMLDNTNGKPFNVTANISKLDITEEDLETFDEADDINDDDWDVDYDEDGQKGQIKNSNQSRNSQGVSNKITSYQPIDKLLRRYANKINVEKYEGLSLPHGAANVLNETNKKIDNQRIRNKDKHDRATVEQVLDPRTRLILFKMLNHGFINLIDGCISTGKEANVYWGQSKTGIELAIKIYKTSILQFKDRDKYVTGEFRFRHGYCRRNPRKMVQMWAEKEFRNLTRLIKNGISAPNPIYLRGNVLLMDFIGTDRWPAPKLKDAVLKSSKPRKLYRECIEMMWRMYNKSRLVHADLSEYNLLYFNDSIVVIDVSQAVEHDHPMAFEFLRKDIANITEFFRKSDVAVMTVQQLFEFITDLTVTEDNMDDYLDAVAESVLNNQEFIDPTKIIEDEVFKQAYIPQNLNQVVDIERDIDLAKSGKNDLIYKTLVGLKSDLQTAKIPKILEDKNKNEESSNDEIPDCNEESDNSEETSDDESSNDEDENDDNADANDEFKRRKDETPEEKKARKKKVKDMQAEKRKVKVKKHVKKRKERLAKKK